MTQNPNRTHSPDVYPRAQALAAGELIDVTEYATREGFTAPVAFTRAAYRYITDAVEYAAYVMGDADVGHYLPGVLDMIRFYLAEAPGRSRVTMSFGVADKRPPFVVVSGPGDAGPVYTVMVSGEEQL